MTLQQAYQKWVSARPFKHVIPARTITYTDGGVQIQIHEITHYDGDCCGSQHFYKDRSGALHAYLDSEVCEREKAWRKYVEIRDQAIVH